jgi:cell division septation protein DedD
MIRKSIGIIITIFVIGQSARAAIYDGGAYAAKKVHENMDISPLGPDLSPAPNGPDSDKLAAAPLGRPFYTVGEDGKCYWSNFSKAKDKTALIVYYSSPISTEHCVYQSIFAPKPSGYSISVKDGGRCVPSHVDVEGESYEWVLTQDGPAVAFATCFGGSTSFGDNIDRKHKTLEPTVAAIEKIEKPAVEEIKPEQEVKSEMATPPTVAAPKGPAPASAPLTAPSTVDVPKAVELPDESASVPVKSDTTRKPSSLEPPYTVQLASYLSLEEAKNAISKLKEKGVDAFTFSGKVSGTTRFRVCTGRFPNSKAARDFQSDLAKKTGITEGFVQLVPKNMEQGGTNSLK